MSARGSLVFGRTGGPGHSRAAARAPARCGLTSARPRVAGAAVPVQSGETGPDLSSPVLSSPVQQGLRFAARPSSHACLM